MSRLEKRRTRPRAQMATSARTISNLPTVENTALSSLRANADDQPVDQLHGTSDDIHMPVGSRKYPDTGRAAILPAFCMVWQAGSAGSEGFDWVCAQACRAGRSRRDAKARSSDHDCRVPLQRKAPSNRSRPHAPVPPDRSPDTVCPDQRLGACQHGACTTDRFAAEKSDDNRPPSERRPLAVHEQRPRDARIRHRRWRHVCMRRPPGIGLAAVRRGPSGNGCGGGERASSPRRCASPACGG
jgi:hypothetical protein